MPHYNELVPNNNKTSLIMMHKCILETKQSWIGWKWYPMVILDCVETQEVCNLV